MEIAHTAISLFYGLPFPKGLPTPAHQVTTDASVFLVIVALAAKSGFKNLKMTMILRTVLRDATAYFLVIFTSHFVLEMTLLLARVSVSVVGDRSDAEISPAKYSTLACRVSAQFELRQRTHPHRPLLCNVNA